ncbi:MAG: glycosyltransferase family 4 protein [Rhizomicrobium sp.]
MASTGSSRGGVLIIVENLPVPFDRRVWSEATTLQAAGYRVAVICPKGADARKSHEVLDGIHIYRHPLPFDAEGGLGYVVEYASALFFEFVLTCWIWLRHGFDVIHACNPPDTIFLIAWPFKLLGKKFLFDHHDINPELYLAKFGSKDRFYQLLCWLERCTFHAADASLATNESYRRIAIERGGMAPDKVFVVRSGPKLERLRIVPPNAARKHGARHLIGYVGVIGQQEGIDLLLEAAKHMTQTLGRTDIRFAIIGGGPALNAMKALSVRLGVDGQVEFYGRVPDDVLLEVLNTADVCVNPDRVNAMNDKSTMNKIMEYMALAKPIVQFELTEGRYSAGEASLYAAPNDPVDFARKILELLDDPAKRAAMGAFGRNRVETELVWEREAPKLLAAYDCLLHPKIGSQSASASAANSGMAPPANRN